MAVTDWAFYHLIRQRIAELRKSPGLAQVQLARHLGVAQQTMARYEGDTVRAALGVVANAEPELQDTAQQQARTGSDAAIAARTDKPPVHG